MIFSFIGQIQKQILIVMHICTFLICTLIPCSSKASLDRAKRNIVHSAIQENVFEQAADNEEKPPKPYAVLHSHWGVGFFGEFLTVIGALHLYEVGLVSGVSIEYGENGTYYDSSVGPNWWENYFEPLHIGNRENMPLYYSVQGVEVNGCMYDLPRIVEFGVCRRDANALINKYIKVKSHVRKKVHNIVKNSFGKSKVIGVHYRGTDKFMEDPLASFDQVAEHVDKALADFRAEGFHRIKIFVATDQQNFLDFMIARYASKVIYYAEATRSLDGNAVHTSWNATPYKKGEDALIDCLLLSKTNIIIKTSSNLSLCSAYFNPDIPIVHVTTRWWHAPLE